MSCPPKCQGVTCPGHNTVEACDGSLLLGDVSLTATQEEVPDENARPEGLQVIGCGSWDVYSQKESNPEGRLEACLEPSHGKVSLTDIGLPRVKSVRKRISRCPKTANTKLVAIVCVVFVVLAVLTVTIVVVRRYRVSRSQADPNAMESAIISSQVDPNAMESAIISQ